MNHYIVNNTGKGVEFASFNSGDSNVLFKPIKPKEHNQFEKQEYLALKTEKEDGYKINVYNGISLQIYQVNTNHPDYPNHIICVFKVSEGNNENNTEHDVEIEPPVPPIP